MSARAEGMSAAPSAVGAAKPVAAHAVHQRIGQLTRELHDALRALGYDRGISAAAHSLPDARDRLDYIATLTGRAAERVLTAVEAAQSEQAQIAHDAARLTARWDACTSAPELARMQDELAAELRLFVAGLASRNERIQARLHEIMMAQDFHDLTGQVIARVADAAHKVEASLLQLLVETRPARAPDTAALAGPVIHPGIDAVSSQGEVDDLLESLGF